LTPSTAKKFVKVAYNPTRFFMLSADGGVQSMGRRGGSPIPPNESTGTSCEKQKITFPVKLAVNPAGLGIADVGR
jgi:hypothetical protein